jgi:alpha-galactosidase
MPIILRSEFTLGDMLVRYQSPAHEPERVGFCLVPATLAPALVVPREHLDDPAVTNLPATWLPVRAWEVDPLVHVHRLDDPANGAYSQGRTLRAGPSTQALRWRRQSVERVGPLITIRTVLADEHGLECIHELTHREGSACLSVRTTARNTGDAPITLGLLTSFSLGGLTPFASNDAPDRLWVHRFRSAWSAEGRPISERIEDLHLEPSWGVHGIRAERFGQVGSLPTNGWFPRLGLEDRRAGVTWAAQLAHPGSWQFELYRRADQLALSGGLADREFGHWTKILASGESFSAPEALLTVAAGDLDSACDRITSHLDAAVLRQTPESERSLPIIFNEWCTTWGNPTHENLIALADRLQNSGIRYLVIDDGWAQRPGPGIQQNGDWIINDAIFPAGLRATADAIRARGLIPGIWFEFEVINQGAKAWDETSHQLHRDGRPLQVGNRRFWDFRDPWVHDYLSKKVIGLLRENHLGYLKVDYNDSIGFGCDGAESPGEALRQHLDGVQRFFKTMREALPDLVIENCSSGGHRLEPSMMELTAMSSFSDAHETNDIPLIAANLHRLIPARQNQTWAVLRPADSHQRLAYSLAATFLGRMCVSGDVHSLSPEQWAFAQSAITLYHEAAPIIAAGHWSRHGVWNPSYRHLSGWQVALCRAPELGRTLVVWHTFAGPASAVAVPCAASRIRQQFSDRPLKARCSHDQLHLEFTRADAGGMMILDS